MFNRKIKWIALVGVLISTMPTMAQSSSINYQAYLTDSDGAPINAVVLVQFDAYNSDVGGLPLWTQIQSIEADQGLISTTLGNPVNPFPLELFNSTVFFAITINGEELQPRRQLASAAFSIKSANSELLVGLPASNFDQSSEVQDLQDQVIDQDNRLTTIEASPSDITAVIAGDGLTGGAQSGSATLSIANGGVTAANMSFNAITGGAIQAGAVNSTKIEDGSVKAIDLATSSVDSTKITDGTIMAEDIGTFAIEGSNLAPFAIGNFQLAGGAVSAEKIQENAVNSNKIANNSIRTEDVQDGAIGPIDIDSTGSYTLSGLNVTGNTNIEGPVVFKAGTGAITIANSLSQVRFFNTSQTQEKASLVVGNSVSLNDVQNNRTMIHSGASGIGIGTTAGSSTPVTLASSTISGNGNITGNATVSGDAAVNGDLTVNGSLDSGYVVINTPMDYVSTISCDPLFPCDLYVGAATCPIGHLPLGGGIDTTIGSSADYFQLVRSFIDLDSDPRSWSCAFWGQRIVIDDIPICQAICLRVTG